MQEYSLFITRIEEAMRSLMGVIEGAEIRKYGLQEARAVYDDLFPYRNMGNGIPNPGVVPKERAVAEAFAMACKHLGLIGFVDLSDLDFLLSEGHKDAAAVKCGSILETHLRKLCVKNGIESCITPASGSEAQPKKAERLNADLAAINLYNKLDQKSVTSWLDLRNKAAHGEYHEYNGEQVSLMIQGVREFMTRYLV